MEIKGMHMEKRQPQGSNIEFAQYCNHENITIPCSYGGITKYFIGLFLLFWLGVWYFGFSIAFDKVISGETNSFIIILLGAWSIGGLFVLFFLFRIFRKSIPEKLQLRKTNIRYDTGIPPFNINFGSNNLKEYWKNLFARRIKYEFKPADIDSLMLIDTNSSNRLTIEYGGELIDLAKYSSEIEREWLYEYLKKKYT